MSLKAFIISVVLCFIVLRASSQNATSASGERKKLYNEFIVDYKKALNKGFTESSLNRMFSKYDVLLTPHSDVTRFKQSLEGNNISIYPLADFKNSKLYGDNIYTLLNSHNPNQRVLAYLLIAASGDISKEEILLKKIQTEHSKGNLLWSGMALLYLRCDHTTALFDFLVKNEDFGDAHMLPMYITLNKDSLQKTAYNRIGSDNPVSKILAAQILSVTPLNRRTEELLINAVKNWDIKIKGYAIYSVKELQIGNLLDTFKPLLDSPQTHRISLEALANSPTIADRACIFKLIKDVHDTIPNDLLDCLYKSKRVDNIIYWLKLMCNRPISSNYHFFVFKQPLINSDDVLPELQNALEKINQPSVLAELVRALEYRTDDVSVGIMIRLLNHKEPAVRYWTAMTLRNNPSPKVKVKGVQEMISKALKDG